MKNTVRNLCIALMLLSAPLAAQNFQSTSALRPSGSQYSPSVAPVGSLTPNYIESPAGSLPSATSGRRNAAMEADDFDSPEEEGRSDQYPVGDGWVMLVFAALCAGGIYLKRRKAAQAE